MRKILCSLGLLAVAAIALSACSDSAAPTTSASGQSGELTSVRVAAVPIAETGALWAAVEEGIFERHGLDVEVVPSQGGAQAIPALLAGDIQFAVAQPFGAFRADLQDLGIVIISNYANGITEGTDVNVVVALESSGITSARDLEGKRVSVNSIGAAGDVTIMKAVEDAGGDPYSIEFVEVGFPDVQAQLEAGNIDAAWTPDPFRSAVLANGGVPVVYPFQATIPGLTVLTNITSQALLDEDPELVTAYSEAMAEALNWAQENPEAVREAIATNLKVSPEAASKLVVSVFTPELNVDDVRELAELAERLVVIVTNVCLRLFGHIKPADMATLVAAAVAPRDHAQRFVTDDDAGQRRVA